MLLLLGLSRLGGVIRYIPESVLLGFTAGIAVVIFVGQWENFLGLPKAAGATLVEKLPHLLASLPSFQPATAALGVLSLLVVALWSKLPGVIGKIPSPLVALVGGTVFVALAHPAGVATIGSVFGGIPRGLPPVTLPRVAWATVPELMRPAFAIALLGAIESLLSATVADGLMGTKHDPSQELIGQGLANMGAALLGGFAATGAIARTATNIRHGGTNPLGGLVHAAVIVLVLLVLAPLAVAVPLATLAAILFVVAFNMGQFDRVWRIARSAPRSDVTVMLVTLLLSVFADLSLAVEVGVILALLNFFRRMTTAVEVREIGEEERAIHASDEGVAVPEDVLVFTIEGPFFFGAIEQFEQALAHTDTDPHAVIIKLDSVPFIDLTGMVALKDAIDALRRRKIAVAMCCAGSDVSERLEKAAVDAERSLPASATLAEALVSVEAQRRG
jgi:SulP family sulfate permease